jgi:hypothetical protein
MNKTATNKKTEKVVEKKEDNKKSKGNVKDEKIPTKDTKDVKKAVKEGEIKKNKNAFIFYSGDMREKVKKDNPDAKPKEILAVYNKINF